MSEQKKSRRHSKRSRYRFSHRQNKLLRFVSQYRFQLLTLLLIVIALIAIIVMLVSDLFSGDPYLSAIPMLSCLPY